MASGSDTASSSKAKPVQALSTMLEGVRDTLRTNINVDLIWELMSKRKDVKKKRKIKQAVRSGEFRNFFGVLREFDLQTFVSFVEVVKVLAITDENHYIAYRSICDRFKNWGLEPDPDNEHHLERLNAMIEECGVAGFDVHRSVCGERGGKLPKEEECCITGAIQDICLTNLKPYSPEVATFYRSQTVNTLYSHIHGVIVVAKGDALPIDSLKVILSVNDYSRPVIVPEGYNACYSALISLKCEPVIKSFLDYVSVSIPHCAVGGLQGLCLLSGSDDGTTDTIILQKEDRITIKCVDGYYFTYQTLHFCANKLAVRAGQKFRRHNSKPYDRAENVDVSGKSELTMMKRVFLELNEIAIKTFTGLDDGKKKTPELLQTGTGTGKPSKIDRHVSVCKSVQPSEYSANSSFVIICYIPRHQTRNWNGLFIGTYDNPTCYKEADALAKQLLPIYDFVPRISKPFVFLDDVLELCPDDDSKGEWHFFTSDKPAVIIKSDVKKVFDRIVSPRLPIVEFEVQVTGKDNPRASMFSIEFKKSSDCYVQKPISLRIPCAITEVGFSSPARSTITIFGNFYNTYSQICSLETLVLNYADYDSRLLLLEISFQLPNPLSFANMLNLTPLNLRELEDLANSGGNFQVRQRECAFKALHDWVCRDQPNPPTVSALLVALNKHKLHLEIEGQVSCTPAHVSGSPIDNGKIGRLAASNAIQLCWKFLARLLGVSEDDIALIEENCAGKQLNEMYEKTSQMLLQWEKQSAFSNKEKKVELYRALHYLELHSAREGSISEFTNALNDIEKS